MWRCPHWQVTACLEAHSLSSLGTPPGPLVELGPWSMKRKRALSHFPHFWTCKRIDEKLKRGVNVVMIWESFRPAGNFFRHLGNCPQVKCYCSHLKICAAWKQRKVVWQHLLFSPCHTWTKEIRQESPTHPFIVLFVCLVCFLQLAGNEGEEGKELEPTPSQEASNNLNSS